MDRARNVVRKKRADTIGALCHMYGYTPEQVRNFKRSDLDTLVEYASKHYGEQG